MALKIKNVRGVSKNVTKSRIQFDDYRECMCSRKEQHRKMNVIRNHVMRFIIKLPSVIMAEVIHAYGYENLKKL